RFLLCFVAQGLNGVVVVPGKKKCIAEVEQRIGITRRSFGSRLQVLDRVFVLLLLDQKHADVVVDFEQRQSGREFLQSRERLLGLTQRVLRYPDVKLSFVVTWILVVYEIELLQGFFVLRCLEAYSTELEYGGGVLILRLLVVLLDRSLKESDASLAVSSKHPL